MTRINLVPPSELHQKHLLAEYRELPRVFELSRKWDLKRQSGRHHEEIPSEYILGPGHVRFFYDKLKFLALRWEDLFQEARGRGFNVIHRPQPEFIRCRPELFNDYTPTAKALEANRMRIRERSPWLAS